MYAVLIPRVPDTESYTYEEVNDRLPVQVSPHLAPDPPRQSENAPRKPAGMQAAFFYEHDRDQLGGMMHPNGIGPMLLGAHVLVGRNQSWTASPRGIQAPFRDQRPSERELPDSFGALIEPIAGGKF